MDQDKVVQVYYINNDETGILFEDYEVKADMEDTEAVIEELLDKMQTMPEKLEYEAPIYGPIKLLSYSYNTGLLTLNFDSSYVETDVTIEILDRAAMVRTLTQIPDVENVAFMIAGNPLTDVNGNIIGNMSADSFVYNAGNEINTYEKVELVLYFATEDGKNLVPVYRSVVYNSNIPMQRLAMEQLLKGPNTDVAFPTLNSQAKINSVSVRDGVCYVDFDNNFLIQPNAVSADVAIYSIVNTLCAITDTNKVQISVGGSSDVIFMETVSLGTVFERNLDIVE
ncbi:GerMN domain-containing protein [Butyrivibrio sp. AE3006]|uniref:GerMN domain-containing protein n=1 Tax=Butyrivibrio sp. AE3006 TaxID=1280673 RepID=UPI00041B029B|nr:GerMN domain-containing protein [Butyrivibrio sp. AE3006]